MAVRRRRRPREIAPVRQQRKLTVYLNEERHSPKGIHRLGNGSNASRVAQDTVNRETGTPKVGLATTPLPRGLPHGKRWLCETDDAE